MSQHELHTALQQAVLVHDGATLLSAIARMGREIARDFADTKTKPLFLTVMNGGLIVGGHLALAINMDFEFDYLHATRYRGETSGGELHWIKTPRVVLRDRHILLVDDILDEGRTLAAVREHCIKNGAASVRIAVLCEKRHGRCVPGLSANYVGVEVPDRYVFGFGMDYYEQGRNLPAIYAL